MKKIKHPVQKVLVHEGQFFYWRGGDMHTQHGVLKEKDLKKAKENVKSHSGKVFKIFTPSHTDRLLKAKRGPQVMLSKDIGLILTNTGIDKNSVVLDAGTGSGFNAATLARFVKKVISYERREEFRKIAEENMKNLDIKNVTIKERDIYEGVKEKNLDLIVLDLAEPDKVVESAHTSLKQGAYLVAYLPSITQVQQFIEKAEELFIIVRITELLEREWHVEKRKVRPQSQMIGHTGFLCFVRKV